jgi:hypothetical protein
VEVGPWEREPLARAASEWAGEMDIEFISSSCISSALSTGNLFLYYLLQSVEVEREIDLNSEY